MATTSTPTPVVPAARLLPTTIETASYADPSRAVISGGVELAASRQIPVGIERPQQAGRFPLIVFAPGYDTSPLSYGRLTHLLAQQGYVVVALSFPLEDPTRGYALDRSDLPNEAQDLRFVISRLLASALAPHLDPSHISLVGHSDGADAVLQAAYELGHADDRIDAVIALAPDALSFAPIQGGPPALIIHGSADEIVDPAATDQVIAALRGLRFEATVAGADHATSILETTPLSATFDGLILLALRDLSAAPSHLAVDARSFHSVAIRKVGSTTQ